MSEVVARSGASSNDDSRARALAQRWGMFSQRAFIEDLQEFHEQSFSEGYRAGILTRQKSEGMLVQSQKEGREEGTKEGLDGPDLIPSSLVRDPDQVPSSIPSSLPSQQGKKELVQEYLRKLGLRSRKHMEEAAVNVARFREPDAALGAVVRHAQRHCNGMPIQGLVATICTNKEQLHTVVTDALAERKSDELRKMFFELINNMWRSVP